MTALAILIIAAVVIGGAVAVVTRRIPAIDPASPRALGSTARIVERGLGGNSRWSSFARDRVDPRVATGLLLTVALVVIVLVGLLVFQVRTDRGVVDLDLTIERWANSHASQFSNDVISVITDLGGTEFLVGIGLVVGIVEWLRTRTARVFAFLIIVIAGQAVISQLIKGGVGRGRPELGALAGLDPSFPSGHSAGAAATFAACALLLGRRRSPRAQALLTGVGVGLAIAVGASRVLLGVHWFSDAIGGLLLGWAWFAVASLAFGGRLLHFGAPVEVAERHRELVDSATEPPA